MNKRIYIIGLLCILCGSLNAQKQQVKNQPYGDQKLYHFGITVGLNFQDMIITNSGHTSDEGEVWYATIPNYSPGFSVGLVTDLYINPYMNIRVTPSLHFGDRRFEFVEENEAEPFFYTNRSNYLTLPVEVKFRSRRVNNYRPYALAGAYAALDLGRKKDEPVLLKPSDYGLSIGIGCDFYLPIIKVAPELRFYFGLADVIEKDRSDITDDSIRKYPDAFSKGTSRMITLTFNFE